MHRKKAILWVLFVTFVVAALTTLTYWRATQKGITATSMEEVERNRGMAVTVEQPVRRDFVRYLFCDGEVQGAKRYYLRSRVGTVGAIAEQVTVDVGDIVREGELLVRFRMEDLVAELEAQKSAYEEAKKNYKRYKKLFEKGVVSAQVLDNRRTMRKRAASALRRARTQMKYARVVSPAGGGDGDDSLYVAERFVDPGEFKRLGDPLLTLADLSEVEVRVQVPESAVSGLSPGTMLEYRVNGAEQWEEGKVARIQPTSTTQNRFFDVFVRTDNERRDGAWVMRPGMFVEARIPQERVSEALAIQASSVDWVGERQYVYIIEERRSSANNHTAAAGGEGERKTEDDIHVVRRRRIKTGLRGKGYVQVAGDVIGQKDQIVCSPRVDLEDGARVWVRDESCGKAEHGGEGD